jgi:hypothetical protein
MGMVLDCASLHPGCATRPNGRPPRREDALLKSEECAARGEDAVFEACSPARNFRESRTPPKRYGNALTSNIPAPRMPALSAVAKDRGSGASCRKGQARKARGQGE